MRDTGPRGDRPALDLAGLKALLDRELWIEGARLEPSGRLRWFASEAEDKPASREGDSAASSMHDDHARLVQTLLEKEATIHELAASRERMAQLSVSQGRALDEITARLAGLESQSEVTIVFFFEFVF